MNILIFSESTDGPARRLQKKIKELCPGEKIQLLSSLTELDERLRQPTSSTETIAVLVIETGDQLSQVVAISHLLEDIRIILVLPDHQKETIALGHRLRPRFLAYSDSDFDDVTAVLEKMVGKPRSCCRLFESNRVQTEYGQGGGSQ